MVNKQETNRLGDFLRELIRQRPRTTLRTLERKSGVSRSEISNIIRGVRKHPNPEALQALAKPLKIDPRYLIFLATDLTFEDVDELRAKYGSQPGYPTAKESIASAANGKSAVREEGASYSGRIDELSSEGKQLLDYLVKADELVRKINRIGKSSKNRSGGQ